MPPSPRPLRIAVVNDYEVVVRGIATVLAEQRDRVEVIALGEQGPTDSRVDIVLVDTFARVKRDLARLDGLVRTDDVKVVVFAWSYDHRAIRAALAAGAAGYLSKTLSTEELLEGLERVHAGETVVHVGMEGVERDGGEGWGRWPGRDRGLSPREAEVVALIAQGLSNREIGRTLFLSINSVKSCIRSAYRKAGVDSRSQAVSWALRHGFVPERDRSPRPTDHQR